MKWCTVRSLVLCAMLAAGLSLTGCDKVRQLSDPFLRPTSVDEAVSALASSKVPVVEEGLKRKGVLTVGMRSSSTAPLLMQMASGKIKGLSVDVACSLADEMGLGIAFVRASDVSGALATTCDVVMDVSAADVNAAADFAVVGSYADSALVLFCKGEALVVAREELEGKAVGLVDGSAAQEALHVAGVSIREEAFSSLDEAFAALEAGSVDLVACHANSGAFTAARYDDLSFAGSLNAPVAEGVAVSSDGGDVAAALRKAMGAITSNGVVRAARERWLGDFPPLAAESRIAGLDAAEQPREGAEVPLEEDVSVLVLDGSTAGANAAVLSAERYE